MFRKKQTFVIETPETLSAELVDAQQEFEQKRDSVITRVTARRQSIAELRTSLLDEDAKLVALLD